MADTLVRAALGASSQAPDRTLQAVAQATSVLPPDMMLALLAHRKSPDRQNARLATDIVSGLRVLRGIVERAKAERERTLE